MLNFSAPVYIALCGKPKAGKSEVQKILEERYGAKSVDDGEPLRDFAMRHLGATHHDVYTQEGKASMVTLPGGKTMLWREFLGEFGNRIEDLLGSHAIPEMAVMKCQTPGQIYSFGSVRRDQGLLYRKHGGIVVMVDNKYIPESKFEFDSFDRSLVQFTIENHVRPEDRGPESLAALQKAIISLFDTLLPIQTANTNKAA